MYVLLIIFRNMSDGYKVLWIRISRKREQANHTFVWLRRFFSFCFHASRLRAQSMNCFLRKNEKYRLIFQAPLVFHIWIRNGSMPAWTVVIRRPGPRLIMQRARRFSLLFPLIFISFALSSRSFAAPARPPRAPDGICARKRARDKKFSCSAFPSPHFLINRKFSVCHRGTR